MTVGELIRELVGVPSEATIELEEVVTKWGTKLALQVKWLSPTTANLCERVIWLKTLEGEKDDGTTTTDL